MSNTRHAHVKNILSYVLLFLLSAVCGGAEASPHHEAGSHGANMADAASVPYGEDLGTVQLAVSCRGEANRHIERGLALLHHMTYEGALAEFSSATETDPECSMGYWGQAMSYIHPLWSDPPDEANFAKGQALVKQAETRGQRTARERAYIEAVEAYYLPGRNVSEKPNLARFEEGWRNVHEQFPDDPEAALFYALSHMATADPADKSYAKQQRAAGLAREVLARIPDHPGAHHYIIHAYDYPPLAVDALPVARAYGDIAPNVAHALHMPTHIFTRLGLWQESIAMNRRSAAAALGHPAGQEISLHHPHALDYLVYAYLQRAEDNHAKGILRTMQQLERPFQVEMATLYTLAAVPARFAVERREWSRAVTLEPRTPGDYPWDQFPAVEAITHFARGLGAAHTGDQHLARQALTRLQTLRDQAAETSDYWATQVEIQRLSVKAWLAFQQRNENEALTTMRHAADMEASTEKHPVTPGEVVPAADLLADMLLESGRPKEAQVQYQAALDRSPNRFNSLYGAARAGELSGNDAEARRYYQQLVEISAATAERDRLQHARDFLEGD